MKYETIFKYRNVWMAIAILWIVCFHAEIHMPFFNKIEALGYGGVDIFLFASGAGCYLSLYKNRDSAVFFIRRISRIFPMYFIFIIVYIVCLILTSGISLQEILGNLLCIGYLAGMKNQFNWYLSCMWLCYLVAPLMAGFLINFRKTILTEIIGVILLFGVSLIYINNDQLILFARFPVFYLGMCMGKKSNESERIQINRIILYEGLMILGGALLLWFHREYAEYLWSYGLHWYPFILVTPGLCIAISYCSDLLIKTAGRFLVDFLMWMGQYTFPVFLTHIALFQFIDNIKVALVLIIPFSVLLVYVDIFLRHIVRKR